MSLRGVYKQMKEIYHQSEQTLFGRLVDDYLISNGDFYTEKVVHEFDDRYIVELQVPGFMDHELDLCVENDSIVLKGFNVTSTRKFVFKNVEKKLIFQHSMMMPGDAGSNTLTARYQPGLLQIVCLRQKVYTHMHKHYLVQRRKVKIGTDRVAKMGLGARIKNFISRALTFESIAH